MAALYAALAAGAAYIVANAGTVAAGVTAVAGVAGAVISATGPKPGAPPPPPKFTPPPLPPVEKKLQAPTAPAGMADTKIGAGALDERRRILSGLPSRTQNTYGGDTGDGAPIARKRLLGGGMGRETTGA